MNIQFVLSELNKKMPDWKIGEEINAPQATVSRLRNGKHKEPSTYKRYEAIKNLAIKHGIDVNAA